MVGRLLSSAIRTGYPARHVGSKARQSEAQRPRAKSGGGVLEEGTASPSSPARGSGGAL